MTENDYKIARELKELLVAQANVIDFRVFGARGDADTESDMDVFVEVESLTPEVKDEVVGVCETA